jgi:hypothetical protein
MRNIAETVLARGFSEMDINASILAEHLESLREGMRLLTSSPDMRQLFPATVVTKDEMGWDQDAGLIRRSGGETTSKVEEKFFFHYLSGKNWSSDDVGMHLFVDFINSCSIINHEAKRIALSIAQEIDAIHAGSGLPRLVPAIEEAHVVTRILRYLERSEGSADAFTHLDRGAITVHWWASHPGLVVFDKNGQPYRIDENAWDRIAVFVGKKFGAFFQGRYGFGTPHGVRDPRRATGHRDGDRYALVTFVHAKLPPESVEWLHARRDDMKAFEQAHAL